MTIIGSPERKDFKNPNLHNYTFKSRASRRIILKKPSKIILPGRQPPFLNGVREECPVIRPKCLIVGRLVDKH
jgi:hypothetical protein